MSDCDVHILHLRRGHEQLARRAVELLKLGEKLPNPHFLSELLSQPENLLLVAVEADEPVGFLIGYALPRIDRPQPMMLLYEIGVAESHQQRGIGRRLVEGFLEWCRKENAAMAWVMTTAGNAAARQLYESAGARASDLGDVLLYDWPKL
ncbi:MAG: GNAT family N-acetyltransferase [Verrucomicrobiota bacterium]